LLTHTGCGAGQSFLEIAVDLLSYISKVRASVRDVMAHKFCARMISVQSAELRTQTITRSD
jgi:hypothetical protein